eukprot:Polyplicarium_translucidae@DN2354_c0_g1_i2.p1
MAAIDILDAPCGALEAAAAAADAAACETANVQGLVEEELSAATLCLAGAYREMRDDECFRRDTAIQLLQKEVNFLTGECKRLCAEMHGVKDENSALQRLLQRSTAKRVAFDMSPVVARASPTQARASPPPDSKAKAKAPRKARKPSPSPTAPPEDAPMAASEPERRSRRRKQTDAVEPPAKVERAEAPKKTDQLSSVKRGRKRLESEPPTRAPRKTSPEVVVNMCDDGSEATVVSGRVTKQRKASARLKQEAASPAATRAGLRSGRVPHRSPSSASRLICKASAPARRGAAAVKAEREAAAEQDREAASRTPIKNRLRRRK